VREFEEKKAADKEALAVEGASANCGDGGKFELNSKLLDQVMMNLSFTDCNRISNLRIHGLDGVPWVTKIIV
jgi:hypothetical protein